MREVPSREAGLNLISIALFMIIRVVLGLLSGTILGYWSSSCVLETEIRAHWRPLCGFQL